MEIRIDLNESRIMDKVGNEKFGLFISSTWKKLIDPYTPRDTGVLMGAAGTTVTVMPFKLQYNAPYAAAVYENSRGVNFITSGSGRNPFATDHWDEKAAAAGQKDKLIKAANNALRSGRY